MTGKVRDASGEQARYDKRRADALVLVMLVAAVMAVGLMFFSGTGENPRLGGRAVAALDRPTLE